MGGMGNQVSPKTLVDRQEMGVGRHTEAGGESVETRLSQRLKGDCPQT